MKWVKNWFKFNEELTVPYYHKELTKEETYKIIKDKCTQFIDVIKNGEIDGLLFRKFIREENMSVGNYLLNPKDSKVNRVAPHSWFGNYHNLLVSNLSSWVGYPRRDKSLISSGFGRSLRHAGEIDGLKIVIPFDKTKVVVSNSNDFWDSFGSRIDSDLPKWTYNLIRHSVDMNEYDDSGLMPCDKNWNLLSKFLEKVGLLDYFNEILNPDGLFNLGYFKDVSNKIKKENEAWLEDECLVVNLTDIFDRAYDGGDYKPKLNSEFLDFIKKNRKYKWWTT